MRVAPGAAPGPAAGRPAGPQAAGCRPPGAGAEAGVAAVAVGAAAAAEAAGAAPRAAAAPSADQPEPMGTERRRPVVRSPARPPPQPRTGGPAPTPSSLWQFALLGETRPEWEAAACRS